MNYSFDKGQLTIGFESSLIGRDLHHSGHDDGLRVQFYWPKLKLTNRKQGDFYPYQSAHKELLFRADTTVRIVWEAGYWGFGAVLLGFGFGVDYQKQPNPPTEKEGEG